MIVLSLFNGCSGAYMALSELGIKIDKYYSSEIDKFAIKAASLINPETIHLGDIVKLRKAITWRKEIFDKMHHSEYISNKTKKYFTYLRGINWGEIDLIAAGSPCQGFSFAGKQLAFDDPRSKLFFEFINILNHVRKFNPDVKFFLENVIMKKEHMRVINEYTGVIGQRINSSLVSAQNRDRMYWSNISTIQSGLFSETQTYIEPPKDRGILLKDILQPESEIDEKYYLSDHNIIRGIEQAKSKIWKYGNKMGKMEFPNDINKKAKTLCTIQTDGGRETNHISVSIGLDVNKKAPTQRSSTGRCLDDKHNYQIIKVEIPLKSYCIDANYFKGTSYNHYKEKKVRQLIIADYRIRRLTPIECMRLQTVPEQFQGILLKSGISDTQLYKMMGNGWNIETIILYFKHLC